MKNSKIAGTLFFLIFFISLFIQDGTLGSIDVFRRYWLSHSFWAGGLPITPLDIPAKQVLVGVNGTLHYWYGMGQSIYMIPGDIISTNLLNLLNIQDQGVINNVATLQSIIIAAITFPVFSAGAVTVAYFLLIELNFTTYISLLGALSLFFGTTLLNYTQEHQENSQILFLTLCGYYFVFKWVKDRKIIFLALGIGLAGSMILMRITSLADSGGIVLFGVLSLFWYKSRVEPEGESTNSRTKASLIEALGAQKNRILLLAITAIAGFGFFGIIDRLYQFKRFGSWTSNYYQILTEQSHAGIFDPASGTLSPGWPFDLPRLTGITNVLFSPEKSLFIYDPLLILLVFLLIVGGFRLERGRVFSPRLALIAGGFLSLLLYLAIYTNFVVWGGDAAWGARYYLSAVQVLCLLAVPLFLEKKAALPGWTVIAGKTLIIIAFVVQFFSILFWNLLEVAQQECGLGSSFRLGQRIINTGLILTGNLHFPASCEMAQGTRIITPNFTPFVGYDMPFMTRLVFVLLWILFLGYFLFALITFTRRIKKKESLSLS